MAFTDVTYYKGEINIPNLNKDTAAFESDYIEVYEKEVLLKALGYKLWTLLIENKGETEGIYKDLISGKEYDAEIRGETVRIKWNGLINTEKISLLSYYVFVRYAQYNASQLTGIGNSVANKENAESVSPRIKMVHAANKCEELLGNYRADRKLYNLQYSDISDYYVMQYKESLFNFLYYNNTDYPDWVFNRADIYGYNRFDL